MAVAMLLATAGIAVAQNANPAALAPEAKFSTPDGYTSHHTIDMGGRMTNQVGSGAMYDTLVNLQGGPRVQGETFEMHALPGNKHSLVDDLSAFGTGFGGDPNNMAKLDASKGKVYEFSGLFRRDRLYSDYDLLANPNIPSGKSIPIGPSNAPVSTLPWPQVNRSPVAFNIVRRMTDTNLTLRPFDTFSYRFSYSHGAMEGPTLSPSYTLFGMKYNALLQQYQRNGSDDFMGAVDWKPSPATKISFEMQANHYKSDTFFTLNPSGFMVQEADGTPAYLGNFTSLVPYGIAACNTGSMGSGYTSASVYTLLSPANKPGNMPIINPACDVVTSYIRSQPTRIWTPTGTLRLQSTALKNISMNGNVHYTLSNMDMPNYFESSQGLNGSIRSAISSGGFASAHRAVFGADYGIVWQAGPKVSLSDQASYSTIHQPGYSYIPLPVTLNTPSTAGNQTINYAGTLTPGRGSLPHGNTGALATNFFGQEFLMNTLTASWDAASRARFSLGYRISNRKIGQGYPHNGDLQETDPVSGQVTINENAGIFNAALRPAKNWDLNGTVEIGYDDNAFTPVSPRQFQQYRVHTMYKPNGWATISGSLSDRERHNNTNNAQEVVASGTAYNGPINHVDHSRVGSVGLQIAPKEQYSLNVNYSYSDVYAATNICYSSGATAAAPGAATVTSSGAPNLCSGNTTWFGRDFMDAPTQFASVAFAYSPVVKVHTSVGYTISDVNGSRFFNDARDVNGSLVSKYQTPFLNLAYTMHPGLIWKAEYNYYGYGEGGPSGAQLCSTATSATATIVPCASLSLPTGMTEGTAGATAPRVFHANNVTLGVHYEF
ncbi:MAG: hypothetical protein WBM14_12750 [Terracidiphilus sp.]